VQAKDPAAQPGQAPLARSGGPPTCSATAEHCWILRKATVGMTRFEDSKSDLGIADNMPPGSRAGCTVWGRIAAAMSARE